MNELVSIARTAVQANMNGAWQTSTEAAVASANRCIVTIEVQPAPGNRRMPYSLDDYTAWIAGQLLAITATLPSETGGTDEEAPSWTEIYGSYKVTFGVLPVIDGDTASIAGMAQWFRETLAQIALDRDDLFPVRPGRRSVRI